MKVEILLHNEEKNYLVVKMDTEDRLETLKGMANVLLEKGYVKESFIEAVQEREKVFPTGLPMEAFGVAIPHTDSIHVNKKAVLCAILEKPNEFVVMATEDDKVMCELAFMLAIEKPHDQLEMLSTLMATCQDVSVLRTLKEANDMDAVKGIMDALMG